jgi:CDP-paratose 2-epimerase
MRILITGGMGFVGSNIALHLRSLLPAHSEIVCMDNLYRKGSEFNLPRLEAQGIACVRGDVREPSSFPEQRFDYLIECSAEPSVLAGMDGAPDYLFNTNLVGLYHCLEKCRRQHTRMLFLSTSRVYPVAPLEAQAFSESETRFSWQRGDQIGIGPRGVSEALSLNGARSLYGYTKLSGEQLIEEYRAAFGLEAVINRCGVIAGPWQFGKVDQGVIALWVMAHLFGKSLNYIGYGGQGKQVRDVLHIADLCELVALQLQRFEDWEGWLGNVSGGLEHSVSLKELTALCQDACATRVPVADGGASRPFDLRIYIGDCTRLFARTSWRPKRPPRDVVLDTANWARTHRTMLQSLWS